MVAYPISRTCYKLTAFGMLERLYHGTVRALTVHSDNCPVYGLASYASRHDNLIFSTNPQFHYSGAPIGGSWAWAFGWCRRECRRHAGCAAALMCRGEDTVERQRVSSELTVTVRIKAAAWRQPFTTGSKGRRYTWRKGEWV